jgi:hypothetical protein
MIATGEPESANYLINVIGLTQNAHGFRVMRSNWMTNQCVNTPTGVAPRGPLPGGKCHERAVVTKHIEEGVQPGLGKNNVRT